MDKIDKKYLIPIIIVATFLILLILLYFFGYFSSSKPTTPVVTTPKVPVTIVVPTLIPTPNTLLNAIHTPNQLIPTPNKLPSDLHPFADLVDAIEPSLLASAKKDYNDIILHFFKIVNSQPYFIDMNATMLIRQMLENEMVPYLKDFIPKYTPPVAAKLLKYFVLKNITAILDNYYTGPPINIVLEAPPDLSNLSRDPFLAYYNSFIKEIYPINFTYTSKTKSKVVNASTIAPFKYFVYNIPSNIRPEIIKLYDEMVDKYMDIINKIASTLPEINMDTLKKLNMKEMEKIQPILQIDSKKIEKIIGGNIPRFITTVFNQNLLPFLQNYYTGPGIFYGGVIPIMNKPYTTIFNYPSKTLNITPLCDFPKVIQIIDGIKTCVEPQPPSPPLPSFSSLTSTMTDTSSSLSITPHSVSGPSLGTSLGSGVTSTPSTPSTPLTPEKSPSDVHPFSDLSELIEPSILPMAKEDYNKIILEFFKIINAQSVILNNSNGMVYGQALQNGLTPIIQSFISKYTPEVGAKIIKYFFIKQLTGILDNYYIGSNINISIPLMSDQMIEQMLFNAPQARPFKNLIIALFPIEFKYFKPKYPGSLTAKSLSPYKNLAYNIPVDIRNDVGAIYDEIIQQYMNIVNDAVKSVNEINMLTINTINFNASAKKFGPNVQSAIMKLQPIIGVNMNKIIKNVILKNVKPLLKLLYKGPGIDMNSDNPAIGNISFKFSKGIPDDSILTITPSTTVITYGTPTYGTPSSTPLSPSPSITSKISSPSSKVSSSSISSISSPSSIKTSPNTTSLRISSTVKPNLKTVGTSIASSSAPTIIFKKSQVSTPSISATTGKLNTYSPSSISKSSSPTISSPSISPSLSTTPISSVLSTVAQKPAVAILKTATLLSTTNKGTTTSISSPSISSPSTSSSNTISPLSKVSSHVLTPALKLSTTNKSSSPASKLSTTNKSSSSPSISPTLTPTLKLASSSPPSTSPSISPTLTPALKLASSSPISKVSTTNTSSPSTKSSSSSSAATVSTILSTSSGFNPSIVNNESIALKYLDEKYPLEKQKKFEESRILDTNFFKKYPNIKNMFLDKQLARTYESLSYNGNNIEASKILAKYM